MVSLHQGEIAASPKPVRKRLVAKAKQLVCCGGEDKEPPVAQDSVDDGEIDDDARKLFEDLFRELDQAETAKGVLTQRTVRRGVLRCDTGSLSLVCTTELAQR